MKSSKYAGESSKSGTTRKQYAAGGRVGEPAKGGHSYPKYSAGGGSGPGRLEKVKGYGGKAKS